MKTNSLNLWLHRRYLLDNNLKPGPTPADFDNYLYDLAEKVWPHDRQLIKTNLAVLFRYLKWLLFLEILHQIRLFN